MAIMFLLVLQGNLVFAQQPETQVTLGIKPDYRYSMKGNGVRVKDLIKGRTAERAGIKAGDIITSLNGKNVKDIFSYRDMLYTFDRGDSVVIVVVRKDKRFIFRNRFE